MRLIIPDEIKKLEKIYEPYIKIHGGLSDDVPLEAKEAYKKVKEWNDKQYKLL